MTPQEGFARAKFQRPGVIIVMGANEAREECEAAADDQPLWRKNRLGIKPASEYPDWQFSFVMRDLFIRFGFLPGTWAMINALVYEELSGNQATDDEWRWLAKKSTGLADVQKWVMKNVKETA